ILSSTMFRDLEQVQNAKESRLARQLRSNIRKPYRFNRIDFNLAFLHTVSPAHSDTGAHPDPHTTSNLPAPYPLAKSFSERHKQSLRPTQQCPLPSCFFLTRGWLSCTLSLE